jgi:hypothetical protein
MSGTGRSGPRRYLQISEHPFRTFEVIKSGPPEQGISRLEGRDFAAFKIRRSALVI